jgi:hypothetical protein
LRNLVHQLLIADISVPPDSSLLESYEELKTRSTPDFAGFFTKTCTKYSNLFDEVVVFFDAMDECEPNQQITICEHIRIFNTCGIRTFITTRFHEDSSLRRHLPVDTTYVQISAKEGDVENFLVYEIERQRIPDLELERQRQIVSRITDGIDGM